MFLRSPRYRDLRYPMSRFIHANTCSTWDRTEDFCRFLRSCRVGVVLSKAKSRGGEPLDRCVAGRMHQSSSSLAEAVS